MIERAGPKRPEGDKSSTRRPIRSRPWRISGFMVLSILVLSACTARGGEEPRFPGVCWATYATPEEAGWSSDGLSVAKAHYDKIGSVAFFVVFDGAVLIAWGDIERRFMCHSVRKSFLSALYGIHVEEETIALEKTLEELNIDDVPPLTKEEKEARISHLLKSRSGVYHAAAYETPTMKERRPARGSTRPGEFWYYNNWDFNALCTIFEQETNTRIFEEFKKRIADPLQMEDFRLMDTYYHLEEQHSIHPAYPFRMSARDMARFGLLFLRNGTWKKIKIVPEEWVKASRRAYSKVPYWEGYGYLWWINTDRTDRKFGMYAALGYGGHMIAVLPGENMVFVHRSNTYLNETVDKTEFLRLIDAVLDAKISLSRQDPNIIPLEAHPRMITAGLEFPINLGNYEGSFQFDSEELYDSTIPYIIGDMIGPSVRIDAGEGRLLMIDNLGQKYFLTPRSQTEFLIEDMEIPVIFEMNDDARPVIITLDGSPAWKISGGRTAAPGE